MQVCVEEDEVNVALQVLQAPQQQLLALLLRLTTFDLRAEVNKKLYWHKRHIFFHAATTLSVAYLLHFYIYTVVSITSWAGCLSFSVVTSMPLIASCMCLHNVGLP